VVYVGLEGKQRKRIEAYLQHHRLKRHELDDVLMVERQPFDLLHPTCEPAVALARDIEQVAKGRPLRAVFIDTLNRALQGGDENSSADMGRAVAAAQAIADRLGCITILVHHSGKDPSKGARGHSSLHGATEVELFVTKKSDGWRDVNAIKVKDGEDGIRWKFRLAVETVGRDAEGDPRTSCVVVDLERSTGSNERLAPVQEAVLMALRELTATKRDDASAAPDPFAAVQVTRDEWRQAYYDLESDTAKQKNLKDRFNRAIPILVKAGKVRDCGRGQFALIETESD
jgi:hypothetical protein